MVRSTFQSTVLPADPATSRGVARRPAAFRRDGWDVRIETSSTLRFADDDWRLESTVRATEGGELVLERTWDQRFARRGGTA
jgi:hypothetical protein